MQAQVDRQLVLHLMDFLGIPYIDSKPSPFMWDGSCLTTRNFRDEPMDGSDLLHEVGHWLVADPRCRTLLNFGLGEAPEEFDLPRSDREKILKDEKLRDEMGLLDVGVEEEAADMIGFHLEQLLGLPFERNLGRSCRSVEDFKTRLNDVRDLFPHLFDQDGIALCLKQFLGI